MFVEGAGGSTRTIISVTFTLRSSSFRLAFRSVLLVLFLLFLLAFVTGFVAVLFLLRHVLLLLLCFVPERVLINLLSVELI